VFVSTADDEIVVSVMGINLHDVPKYRLFTYLNHWLGFQMAFFTDAGAKASGK
jgi:hypothetical protein